jgi:hypothetical protein
VVTQVPAVPSPSATPFPASPTSSATKTSPLLKFGIAAIVIIFVGGALAMGGIFYVAHRVSQKIHEVTGGLIGSGTDSNASAATRSDAGSDRGTGDACRMLSKEDVSRGIGVEIIRAEPTDNGCSYIAHGDQADMTARHTTAMMASRGADKKTQQMIQTISGGMFKVFQSESKEAPTGNPGEVMVFGFGIDRNAAEMQMRLNAKMLGNLGPNGAEGIPDIGDQAFASGDSMLMVRKGNNLVRIMYMTCPCNTDAVKPLARKIADAL